jgi:hypothetical protein
MVVCGLGGSVGGRGGSGGVVGPAVETWKRGKLTVPSVMRWPVIMGARWTSFALPCLSRMPRVATRASRRLRSKLLGAS